MFLVNACKTPTHLPLASATSMLQQMPTNLNHIYSGNTELLENPSDLSLNNKRVKVIFSRICVMTIY